MVVYTYRYFWKDKEGKLFVKFITDSQENLNKFHMEVMGNEDVVSCMREYVSEVNLAFIGFTEPIKEVKKEEGEKENEEIC